MTKKRIDITHVIMAAHEDFITNEISLEVEKELKDGLPDELRQRVLTVMELAKQASVSKAEITSINTTQLFSPFLGEFELLAAAGKQSENTLKWFEEFISIAGYEVEINPWQESDSNMVLITITKKELNANSLDPYAGKEIEIAINKNKQSLLTAKLYIFPNANLAEGEGLILSDSIPELGVNTKFTLDIVDNK